MLVKMVQQFWSIIIIRKESEVDKRTIEEATEWRKQWTILRDKSRSRLTRWFSLLGEVTFAPLVRDNIVRPQLVIRPSGMCSVCAVPFSWSGSRSRMSYGDSFCDRGYWSNAETMLRLQQPSFFSCSRALLFLVSVLETYLEHYTVLFTNVSILIIIRSVKFISFS